MNISDFTQCSNCGACYNICPKGAISLKTDGLFYTPSVDNKLCVDCSKCAGVCPVNREIKGNAPAAAFSGWHKDSSVVLNSSSGGVFYGIANAVVLQGGVVFAAVFSGDCREVVFASSDEVPINAMLKSKYVESRVGFTFQRIKTTLESGRKVMFTGTPCQVAGLRCFLGQDFENLVTCDFACGGLPSHQVYQEYLSGLEQKYASKAVNVDFRHKSHGWKRYVIRVDFQNGKKYLRLGIEDPYLKSFLYGKCSVRDYCLDCKFPEHHMSDITIADFWRHKNISTLENENGISLILCNTQKGRNTIDSIKHQFVLSETDLGKALYNNRIQISEKAKNRQKLFLQDYKKYGLKTASKKYIPFPIQSRLKHWLVRELFGKRRISE